MIIYLFIVYARNLLLSQLLFDFYFILFYFRMMFSAFLLLIFVNIVTAQQCEGMVSIYIYIYSIFQYVQKF